MSWLAKADFKFSIDQSVLDNLTGGDDTIWQELTDEAVNEMSASLNSRYDVSHIFGTTGTGRDKTIMMYCRDLVLYHLFSIYSFRAIPQIRIDRYNHALQWLQDVSEQKINPEGLPLNTKSFVKYGSNDKRVNQQQ